MQPVDLHVIIEKEGGLFSALCLELNIASQSKTFDEAKKISERLWNYTLKM